MTEVMNPQIWENFPKDLFESVFAQLPIATIIRFRAVCKQWNNIITSHSFSQHCSQANQWFYITFLFDNSDVDVMYDPFMKRWYCCNTFKIPACKYPVSSAGGLVCFHDRIDQNVYVCNPVTQSFKKLSVGSIKSMFHLGMTVNGRGGYRVLRFGFDGKYEIYDSETENWGNLDMIPACVKNSSYIVYMPISINNTLYFRCIVPDGILSCNMSTGVWTHHLIQAPLHSSHLELTKSDGRIMLVGILTENNDAKCVCIWEVQKVTFLLKEVDRWPCSDFSERPVNLSCLGNKDLLLCYLISDNMYRLVTYNIATRKWDNVCVPDGIKFKENFKYAVGIAFQPCLTAMP